ncbi:hypothetical protein HDU96_002488 [Phlyctochytrium bullatum]|nr:hypothetical protein HDU96_002488 [Phlyctochytrium bullatum]
MRGQLAVMTSAVKRFCGAGQAQSSNNVSEGQTESIEVVFEPAKTVKEDAVAEAVASSETADALHGAMSAEVPEFGVPIQTELAEAATAGLKLEGDTILHNSDITSSIAELEDAVLEDASGSCNTGALEEQTSVNESIKDTSADAFREVLSDNVPEVSLKIKLAEVASAEVEIEENAVLDSDDTIAERQVSIDLVATPFVKEAFAPAKILEEEAVTGDVASIESADVLHEPLSANVPNFGLPTKIEPANVATPGFEAADNNDTIAAGQAQSSSAEPEGQTVSVEESFAPAEAVEEEARTEDEARIESADVSREAVSAEVPEFGVPTKMEPAEATAGYETEDNDDTVGDTATGCSSNTKVPEENAVSTVEYVCAADEVDVRVHSHGDRDTLTLEIESADEVVVTAAPVEAVETKVAAEDVASIQAADVLPEVTSGDVPEVGVPTTIELVKAATPGVPIFDDADTISRIELEDDKMASPASGCFSITEVLEESAVSTVEEQDDDRAADEVEDGASSQGDGDNLSKILHIEGADEVTTPGKDDAGTAVSSESSDSVEGIVLTAEGAGSKEGTLAEDRNLEHIVASGAANEVEDSAGHHNDHNKLKLTDSLQLESADLVMTLADDEVVYEMLSIDVSEVSMPSGRSKKSKRNRNKKANNKKNGPGYLDINFGDIMTRAREVFFKNLSATGNPNVDAETGEIVAPETPGEESMNDVEDAGELMNEGPASDSNQVNEAEGAAGADSVLETIDAEAGLEGVRSTKTVVVTSSAEEDAAPESIRVEDADKAAAVVQVEAYNGETHAAVDNGDIDGADGLKELVKSHGDDEDLAGNLEVDGSAKVTVVTQANAYDEESFGNAEIERHIDGAEGSEEPVQSQGNKEDLAPSLEVEGNDRATAVVQVVDGNDESLSDGLKGCDEKSSDLGPIVAEEETQDVDVGDDIQGRADVLPSPNEDRHDDTTCENGETVRNADFAEPLASHSVEDTLACERHEAMSSDTSASISRCSVPDLDDLQPTPVTESKKGKNKRTNKAQKQNWSLDTGYGDMMRARTNFFANLSVFDAIENGDESSDNLGEESPEIEVESAKRDSVAEKSERASASPSTNDPDDLDQVIEARASVDTLVDDEPTALPPASPNLKSKKSAKKKEAKKKAKKDRARAQKVTASSSRMPVGAVTTRK